MECFGKSLVMLFEENPEFSGLSSFQRFLRVVSNGAIRAVDLYQLVVDAENEKRRGPLADEERFVLLLRGLKGD